MIDYSSAPSNQILCIDMRSFYASCTSVLKGVDPMQSRIAIVGDRNQKGSVILAASPYLKKRYGIRTGSRLHEIPLSEDVQLEEPSMGMYMNVSMKITQLFHRYVPRESIHIYSVDECFIQVDGASGLWGGPEEIAASIADDLMRQFQLPCAIGIGPNMLLAKLALDLEAKKTQIARWDYVDVPRKLWPVTPLSSMWGIGRQVEKRLNRLGIFSVGDLANSSLRRLEKEFGIMGNQLYYHANGLDLSELGAPIMNGQVSFGKSQILLRDYTSRQDVEHVVLEMCEDVARRARRQRLAARTVHFGVGYSHRATVKGFHRSRSLHEATSITMELYHVCLLLLNEHLAADLSLQPVRKLSISLTNLETDSSLQLDFWNPRRALEHGLGYTVDDIRDRYGSASLLRAVSYTQAGTARRRARLIGGHKANAGEGTG